MMLYTVAEYTCRTCGEPVAGAILNPEYDDAGNKLATCRKCEQAIDDEARAEHPHTPRMEALCASIPSLRGKQGTQPWSPTLLAERYGTASGGEGACIAFVLFVWNHHPGEWDDWDIPTFGIEQFAKLDDANQKAVAAWFADPFWP